MFGGRKRVCMCKKSDEREKKVLGSNEKERRNCLKNER